MDLLATGVGGVLYPPHILPKETFNLERIFQCSLPADDIWLKFMEVIAGIPVVVVEKKNPNPVGLSSRFYEALSEKNVNEFRNDRCIRNIMEIYQIERDDFFQVNDGKPE